MAMVTNASVDLEHYLIGWRGFGALYTLAWQARGMGEWGVLRNPATGRAYRDTVLMLGRLAVCREVPATDEGLRGFRQTRRITL